MTFQVGVTPLARHCLKLSRRHRQSLTESRAKVVKIFEFQVCFVVKKKI